MSRNNNKKIFVAMSGGVDSSVAVLLLHESGYDVTGVFMRCYNVDGCAERDVSDARRVAACLNIPFYVFDFEEDYKRRVVEYMVEGYRQGITPNPDVMCNKEIKFGLFLKKALSLGADYIATGHYVRLQRKNILSADRRTRSSGERSLSSTARSFGDQAEQSAESAEKNIFSLHNAKDKNKDQSYFLWTLTQDQLKHCLFPIGDYLKSEVREIARRAGLPTADKKDSQGICFLGKVTLQDFLKNYIPEEKGFVFTTAGEKLGEHNGAWFYTIGQRRIGVSGGEPVYVVEKDVKTNTVVVAEKGDNSVLYRKEVELTDVNFLQPMTNDKLSMILYTRIRYRQPLVKATLIKNQSSVISHKLIFDQPQKFIAPGQSAVFYLKSGELLGGGVIV